LREAKIRSGISGCRAVRCRTTKQQQSGERDQVGVDHPGLQQARHDAVAGQRDDVPALTLTQVPNDLGGIVGHDQGIAPSGLGERAGYDHFSTSSSHRAIYPVPTHAFHIFWSFLPEASHAIARSADSSAP
jgi:hypothetical protein